MINWRRPEPKKFWKEFEPRGETDQNKSKLSVCPRELARNVHIYLAWRLHFLQSRLPLCYFIATNNLY